jgi:hypothetical protein
MYFPLSYFLKIKSYDKKVLLQLALHDVHCFEFLGGMGGTIALVCLYTCFICA